MCTGAIRILCKSLTAYENPKFKISEYYMKSEKCNHAYAYSYIY